MFKKLSERTAFFTLALIVIAAGMLMFWASHGESAIDDELAHISAGYSYVHELDYRLNPEHPPLVKALAAVPLLFLHPNFPTQSPAWQSEVDGQWDVGALFLYKIGNNADQLIQTARIVPILLTLLLIILTYLLARSVLGPWWALLPTLLFAFDPTVLAQGHYVTTDLGAGFGVVLATYFYLRFAHHPSHKNIVIAGLTFGIAQLTKFSAPLLIPLPIFLTVIAWLRDGAQNVKNLFYRLWRVILIFIIGYVVIVYPVYFLFTVHYPIAKQVSDTQALLGSFAGGPPANGHFCSVMRCIASFDIWMAKSPVLRPVAEYLLGILMVLQRAAGGNTIYFLGQVRGTGGWIYFPTLFLLKEPLPTLIIVLTALALALGWMISKTIKQRFWVKESIRKYLHDSFPEFVMASFVVLYWGYSIHSPLNIGLRHLLPTLPFIFILAAVVWKKWITRINFPKLSLSIDSMMASAQALKRSIIGSSIKYVVLVLLICWLILETLFAAPYFTSYFNEFAGGTWGGYHYVTDSNYDWGQDLLRLQSFVATHPEIDKIGVDYFGGGDPQYSLGNKEVDWSSAKGDPRAEGIHWLAVSVNQLQNAIQPLAPGQTRNASDTYSWLTALRPPAAGMGNVPPPDFRAGTSIFIYRLP